MAIEYGEKIGLKWTWTDNKPLDDPKSFMLGSVQTYMNQLFNEGEKEGENIRAVAQTILKYYPDDVENLSNLAVSYLFKKNYANALDPLLKAEKIAPTDYIVLNNIAYCYGAQGDKKNAIKYYELVENTGMIMRKRLLEKSWTNYINLDPTLYCKLPIANCKLKYGLPYSL